MNLYGLGLQLGYNHEQNSGPPGESKITTELECLTSEKRLAQSGKKEALGGSDSSFPMLTRRSWISTAVFWNSLSPKRAFDNRSGGQGFFLQESLYNLWGFLCRMNSGMVKFSVI